MKKVYKLEMSDFELDQLKESVNIGASHASTALAQIIDQEVSITVPEVHIDNVENTVNFIGDSEKISTTVIVKVLGDTTGVMFFLFPGNSGHQLARMITNSREMAEILTQSDRSALSEVGNILSGACLTALSKFLGISLLHSVSEVVTDILGSIINSVMRDIRKASDLALVFKVSMHIGDLDIETQMFFLMDPEFTERILLSTQKKFTK